MRKYQSYKPSKVDWIGEIPDTWEETHLKYVGNLYGGLTGKSGEDFKQEDNPNNKPYIPYTNIFRNTYISKNHVDYVVLEDGENQNKVQKFDLFFLMSSETYQDLGKSCILIDDIDELYLNSFCKGFRVNRKDVNPLFLNYQLLGSVHKELISIEGRGFTRINLRQDRLNETPIFLPPLQEQHQIVQFLDSKTELIDKLISTKERKITLLKEQRTSLINQVVIKGLNPNVKMKDSGVEWIGEIPEGWNVCKLKYVGKINSGDTLESSKIESEGEYPVYGGNGIMGFYSEFNYSHNVLSIGRVGEKCGNVHKVISKSWINDNSLVLDFDSSKFSFDFLFYTISSRNLNVLRNQNTQPLITGTIVKNEFIPLIELDEQNKIVEYLDSKTKEIDDMVELEQKKIDLLKEYRQSLISEVVTGKIKVTTDE